MRKNKSDFYRNFMLAILLATIILSVVINISHMKAHERREKEIRHQLKCKQDIKKIESKPVAGVVSTSKSLVNFGVSNISKTIKPKTNKWKNIGKWRITYYCAGCNSPRGTHRSASGVRLRSGHVAMNGVKFGTKIKIGKKTYTVVDRVGKNRTVDIFVASRRCKCSGLHRKTVYRKA